MKWWVFAVGGMMVWAGSSARATPPRCKPPRIAHRGACHYPDDVEREQKQARDKRLAARQAVTAPDKPATPTTIPPTETPTAPVVERVDAKAHRAPTPASQADVEALGIEWISIASKTFPMGSRWGDPDEKPVRNVRVPGFRLAKSETTVAQYRACVAAGWCDGELVEGEEFADFAWESSRFCNAGRADHGTHPMNCVSWWEALAFCEWVGGRLPTEAEWELAATGGTRMYPWGDAPATCEHAQMFNGEDGCGTGTTATVCERPAGRTPEGVCDMGGNVWEWVADWYGAGHYAEGATEAPTGPAQGSTRVRRGGSFRDEAGDLRSTNRWFLIGVYRSATLGFRCAGPL
jgi:formylglycine-generating enzyme required for sulfatase activity